MKNLLLFLLAGIMVSCSHQTGRQLDFLEEVKDPNPSNEDEKSEIIKTITIKLC